MRKPVQLFAEAMEAQLKEHDAGHPAGWSPYSNAYLLSRMMDKFFELRQALSKHRSYQDVRDDCVDVANFAMMLFDNHNHGAGQTGEQDAG